MIEMWGSVASLSKSKELADKARNELTHRAIVWMLAAHKEIPKSRVRLRFMSTIEDGRIRLVIETDNVEEKYLVQPADEHKPL